MKKNIEISEVFTIDTDENRCALLFCLQLQYELEGTKMLFLTANNFQLVHDNLERVKPYVEYFDALHANTKYLFLKDSWLNLNEQYGVRALSHELSALVEHSEQKLFFMHRIDLFFDKVFNQELEDVIIGFIKDIRYHHKKVIFSYNSKTATGKAFEELLAKRRDISYHIEEDKSDVDGDCYTTIKTYNKFLKKEHAEIVLISQDKDIIKMHETIFSTQKNINFKHTTVADVLHGKHHLSETTDVIIYNDAQQAIDDKMVTYFKSMANFARVFEISEEKFLRKTDRRRALDIGIEYIVPKNFDISEYIESIENIIENDFYTKKVQHFYPDNKSQEVSFEDLRAYSRGLKKQNIIFSIMSIGMEHLVGKDINTLIREEDCIYHDSSNNSMVFLFLNLLGSNALDIIAKRFNVKKRVITLYDDITID